MTLADLIDLEAQLARDRSADPGALDARDAGSFPEPPRDREALVVRWLQARRDAEPGQLHPGRTVANVLRGMRAALVVSGLVLGWGAATAVLRYTGEQPVNAWDFLLVFVGVQLLLFALLIASFLFPVAALGTPLFGLFRGLVAAVYPRLAARAAGASAERLAEWRVLWHRLRSRRSLYHHLEPWILLGLTQSFGVAFNVGALLGCLRLIVFSDIAFSWSTTLVQLDAARFHGLVHALAAPFAWLWPDADPSRALVEATRYSRLEGSYVLSGAGRAAHPELVGGWWPFLLASLAFYGLLPRCITLGVAAVRRSRLLARIPLDDPEVTRVVRRLSEPRVETRSLQPEVGARPSLPAASAPLPAAAANRCALILWRDVPAVPAVEAAVLRQTTWAVSAVQPAGGRDYEEGRIDWTHLANGSDPVVIVAEGWEAPDKAILRMMRELRRALGARRHLVVLLAAVDAAGVRAASASDVRIWEESLAALEDPYVAVQTLKAAP
ncbi:MAG TPA: DUF2868 domain-containing protein [Myxococcales bacterium]|nr:DUF2868 domain-containing protein [Myxococcales bacterium]